MTKRVRRGFTLPEILVTVTVVAVLAAVVVPSVTQYITKGDKPATQQDVDQLRTGITGFITDVRKYPGTLQALSAAITTTDSTAQHLAYIATDVANWKGPYLSSTVVAGVSAFTSPGLGVTVGDTIGLVGNWLRVKITSPTTCGAIAHLDSLLDGGDGGTAGSVFYSGTCATPTTAVDSAFIRLVPAT